ncbi:unnamed protein product (macronuclear) [Paramecium tetraurelia]|uniref:Tr-type G domain-containing protein n=1 Tax=Paramecium tetraurelia TaxID=5888 RepID=A0C124_PARTE|nr:uncharacterized protein GSPATT00033967001 [Paramecium tetraurelia]CAK64491.1 unnamed protein product [Paramecium tetraurelia]|eukprot:XP_001431889.1 hypothetical protein (macronuclear) [Paramecium tetraurelia strain d4-2]
MDDMNNYDEFGNYIGPEIDSEEEDNALRMTKNMQQQIECTYLINKLQSFLMKTNNTIQMHNKQEDAQPITQPMIAPLKSKEFDIQETQIPQTTFDYEFLCRISKNPALVRNVAIVGGLHHGKTSMMDVFVKQTHLKQFSLQKDIRYTDTRQDEQQRLISIKAIPMSLLLPNSKDKSYLINLYDTPGHVNFMDEVCCALRASDAMLLIIDVIEGVMMTTEMLIKAAVKEKMPIVVVINKIDRLIIELKLPPSDAYLKIKNILDEVNIIISDNGGNQIISPLNHNVVFGSGLFQFVFTIQSFARRYNNFLNPEQFTRLLWGDIYYDNKEKKFVRKMSPYATQRTFVEFILEPIYKLFGQVVSKDKEQLEPFLLSQGISLKKSEFKMDTRPLLKLVCSIYFGNTSSLVDVLVEQVPNSQEGSKKKMELYYQGDKSKQSYIQAAQGSHKGPLCINVVKLYSRPDCMSFDALGRVVSGTIKKGQNVKLLGEKYNIDDEEDMAIRNIKNIYIYQGRYRVEVNKVPAGNWVLIEGIDQFISKSATITEDSQQMDILRPIQHNILATMKIAIEPLVPSELPKMLEGLRKVTKSYPILTTKVEESGEHILLGTGELYLDCVMHDLRKMYSEIEIKVSDPSVRFCETVIETSSKTCYADTPNKKNRIKALATPLDKGLTPQDKGLAERIENEEIDLSWPKNKLTDYFKSNFNLGYNLEQICKTGPNVFIDDTLPSETNKQLLTEVKDYMIQGFQWATREGPLCDEPIRNVKFKIIEANIANEPIYRGGGQIIPTTRRVCYSSFLMATPKIMEPMLLTEIMCFQDCIPAIHNVLLRRRGHILSEQAKPGTPFSVVRAHIPTIDHFGFETDLRVHTSGQAFCLSVFDHWSLLPGDPLDKTIVLKPLEPAPSNHLAREFMIKTRRRKGLNEDVSILKFFDDQFLIDSLKQDKDYQQYI